MGTDIRTSLLFDNLAEVTHLNKRIARSRLYKLIYHLSLGFCVHKSEIIIS